MKTLLSSLTISLILPLASSAFAVDIEAGKKIAGSRCVACHGSAGISTNGLWPNLAGQHAPYLEKQIKDFRDKKRVDPVMNAMVAGMSDVDAKNIAAYYNSLK